MISGTSGHHSSTPVVVFGRRARYDFLLVFHIDPMSRWNRGRVLSIHKTRHRANYVKTRRHPQKLHSVCRHRQEDQTTATDNMHKNLVKFGCVGFEICQQADRQTDRQTDKQTDIFITILCITRGGE